MRFWIAEGGEEEVDKAYEVRYHFPPVCFTTPIASSFFRAYSALALLVYPNASITVSMLIFGCADAIACLTLSACSDQFVFMPPLYRNSVYLTIGKYYFGKKSSLYFSLAGRLLIHASIAS